MRAAVAAAFAVALSGVAAPARADGFTISGSVRARYEAIDGQIRPGFNDSDAIFNLRNTLFVGYATGPVRFGAEIYDSRVYFDDPGTPIGTNEVNAAELVQAYVAVDLGDGPGDRPRASVQAGRYMLNLGARRLVAADDYRNTTNGYTGLRADLNFDGAGATLIYVLPQVRLPDDASLRDNAFEFDRESFDLQLYGGVGRFDIFDGAALELSAFRLFERDRPDLATRDRRLDTFGVRFYREDAKRRFDFDVEAFGQFGTASESASPAAAERDVGAFFVHAEAGWRVYDAWKLRLAAEFDHASGEKPGGDIRRFDTLFGMRRAEIAPAGLYNAVGRANLSAPGLRIEGAPNPRTDFFVGYRALFLASGTDVFSTSGVRDATGGSGAFAGHQLDARLRVWIFPKKVRFEANGVVVAHGRFLDEAPNGPASDTTTYGSLNMTFQF